MKFRDKFARFMYGRYGYTAGFDGLSKCMLTIAIIVLLLSGFVNSASRTAGTVMYVVSLLILALSYYRFFSKNLSARTKENYKYYEIINKIKRFFVGDPNFKYFQCPGCKKKVRVPKNRGKIEITCKNCNTTFIRFTGKRK
ncbi:MAG: hypothetical protein MJ124_05380 [Lachnospiraceae bacterium]|nr:hypothetical protein [Lachnospiraceae bacterium]